MAKESMKAREVKRAKLVAKYAEKRKALKEAGTGRLLTSSLRTQALVVFTTAALLQAVRRDICVCSESAVSSSARWQATDLSRA